MSIPINIYRSFLLCLILCATSCGQNNPKHEYREIVIESPERAASAMQNPHQLSSAKGLAIPPSMNVKDVETQKMLDASVADISLVWKTPPTWSQSKGSGMRLVTFKNKNESEPIECSIVSLGGMAGGLESNIVRWMRQINLTDLPEDKVSQFVDDYEGLTSDGGLAIKIFDFTKLQAQEPDSVPSMIGAIVTIGDKSIFVKMTGTKSTVIKNYTSFKELCQSLKTPND